MDVVIEPHSNHALAALALPIMDIYHLCSIRVLRAPEVISALAFRERPKRAKRVGRVQSRSSEKTQPDLMCRCAFLV